MTLRATLIAGLLVLAAAAGALGAGADPVKITADQFVIDDTAHVATFTGKVIVKRSTSLTVWAPKVVVDYGDGGPSNIKSFVATGGVRIKTTDQDATGDKAVYDPDKQILRLTGNVMVTNSTGTVGGPELVVNLATNTSVFTGGKGGRVTGVFTPK